MDPDLWEALTFSVGELSAHAVQALMTAFETNPLMSRAQLAHLVRSLQDVYGRAASQATADTIITTRAAAGRLDLPAPKVLDVIGLAQASAVAGYALAGSDPAARAAASVDRLVRNAQRQTVYEAAARAGTGFARVPEPGACAFCLMLASRGAVYTRDTVLRTTSQARAGAGQSYHDHCHCRAQEILSAGDVPPVVAGLHEQWRRMAAGSPGGVVRLDQWREYVHAQRVAEAEARDVARRKKAIETGGVSFDAGRVTSHVTTMRVNRQGVPAGGHLARHAQDVLALLGSGQIDLRRGKTFFPAASDAQVLQWLGDETAGAVRDVLDTPDGLTVPPRGWRGTAYHRVVPGPAGGRVRLVVSIGPAKPGTSPAYKVISVYPDAGDGVTAVMPPQDGQAPVVVPRPLGSGEYD